MVFLGMSNVSYADTQRAASGPPVVQENLSATLVKQMQLPNQQDQNKVDPVTEATAVSNRYQAMSDIIKSRQQEIGALHTNNSLSSISVIAHLEAIITVIEVQCKKLIDLIAKDPSATTSPDSEMLNSIVDKLDKQRKSLLDLITTQSQPPLVNPTVNPNRLNSLDNTNNNNTSNDDKFTVFNPDK